MVHSHKILLWIGSAIGISVATAWALTMHHSHAEYVTRPEMQQIRDDIRELRQEMSEQFRLLLEKVMHDANTR